MPRRHEQDQAPSRTDVDPASAADTQARPSKSQRKRDAQALQVLGARLVTLSPAQLARMALPDALYAAVVAAQGMRQHGARTRQMQYIGRLMRELEPTALRLVQEALASLP
jgi:ribosome-associated protein